MSVTYNKKHNFNEIDPQIDYHSIPVKYNFFQGLIDIIISILTYQGLSTVTGVHLIQIGA